MTMEPTLFSKIIDRAIPADIIYEDEVCLAFHDINKQAPMHILVIPKVVIPRLVDALPEHKTLLGHMLLKARDIASEQGVGDAFRLVINNGEEAGQSVFHLHIHLLAGRCFSWPPG